MAKIKHTKNELKAQRDALKRFERYLPTLQLKKQQLQIEVRQIEARLREKEEEARQTREHLDQWVALFSQDPPLAEYLTVKRLVRGVGNIAGVDIPVLHDLEFDRRVPDLFRTPSWWDDALNVLETLVQQQIELQIIREQHARLAEELRTTSQRVNLFEKVKIPEARENIRVIKVFLGDQQTASVVRSKIAKNKTTETAGASS